MPRVAAQRVLIVVLTAWCSRTSLAQCPGSGLSAHDRCWYMSDEGKSCSATCATHSLSFSHFVAPDATPMTPQILGRNPGSKQFAWGRLECFVPSQDRYHTAKPTAGADTGDKGEAGDWSVSICRLSCPCSGGAKAVPGPPQKYPECVQPNIVLRHAGAHAIFVDVSAHGATGCWQNDCKNTDKFNADDKGVCARTCSQIDECTHWAFGEQEGAKKCFFRKSDGGREHADDWVAGPKECAPPALPDAFVARTASQLLIACDGGKSDACPDMARAITTWRFAIKHLKKATDGKLDANTNQYITQVDGDTDTFAGQMREENFLLVLQNNRQVFQALGGWMSAQPGGTVDPNDPSLPNPLRGKLCGPSSCYDTTV